MRLTNTVLPGTRWNADGGFDMGFEFPRPSPLFHDLASGAL
jgi:hypothetical protein